MKYGFGYVPVQSLRGGLYDTTRRFGQSIARLGLAFIICAAVADFGMWESMQPSYGYGDSSGIIGIMNYQSLIRRIVLFCAAVLLPILIAATRYRTSLLLIGLAAMLTILTANILVLLYSFQDISYNYFYSYRATYPPYMFWPMLFTLLLIYFLGLFGFWMVAAGIGFARNENPARRAMQAAVLSMIGMMVISAVLVFAFIASESRGRVFRFVDLKLVVVIVVALFFLVPPGYLFFELFRYFGSGKAKAWCNAGEYTPPWRVQVDTIKALVEDEGGEGIQPER
ncbi:MAG: hypothetical protein E3J72_01250 [Planctomycetota bacterium]|nr:MAG: hypothetical protein E3J72_01250 [Planctomycetota bacterium]